MIMGKLGVFIGNMRNRTDCMYREHPKSDRLCFNKSQRYNNIPLANNLKPCLVRLSDRSNVQFIEILEASWDSLKYIVFLGKHSTHNFESVWTRFPFRSVKHHLRKIATITTRSIHTE